MPLLPLKALRRNAEDGENASRRRVTRGVVLAASREDATPVVDDTPVKTLMRSRTVNPADIVGEGSRSPVAEATPSALTAGRVCSPCSPTAAASVVACTPHSVRSPFVVVSPTCRHVKWAPSPLSTSTEITPYATVYGVHPAFFDFDRTGRMQPTHAGDQEIRRGALPAMTPTAKGKVAFIVQGQSPADASPLSSPLARGPALRPPQAEIPYAVGERVLVLTDDRLAWMDAYVMAVYPTETEAEGYSIPGGTVKVSYELGIKWVMPESINTTLRKKPVSFGNLIPQVRQVHHNFAQRIAFAATPAWQVFPGHLPYVAAA